MERVLIKIRYFIGVLWAIRLKLEASYSGYCLAVYGSRVRWLQLLKSVVDSTTQVLSFLLLAGKCRGSPCKRQMCFSLCHNQIYIYIHIYIHIPPCIDGDARRGSLLLWEQRMLHRITTI